jgi:hypothetical protein
MRAFLFALLLVIIALPSVIGAMLAVVVFGNMLLWSFNGIGALWHFLFGGWW